MVGTEIQVMTEAAGGEILEFDSLTSAARWLHVQLYGEQLDKKKVKSLEGNLSSAVRSATGNSHGYVWIAI